MSKNVTLSVLIRRGTSFEICYCTDITYSVQKHTKSICHWTIWHINRNHTNSDNVFIHPNWAFLHFLIFTDLLLYTISKPDIMDHLFDYLNQLPINRWQEIGLFSLHTICSQIHWQNQRENVYWTNLFEKKPQNYSHGCVSHILWAKALGVDLWMQEKHVHGNSLPINAIS